MSSIVIIESPFSGDRGKNTKYALKAMRDCFNRGEVPFASHLLYTQVLDDTIPEEREMGIEAGLVIAKRADKTVVYTDLGISPGMQQGIDRAISENRPVEYRSLA